MLLVQAIGHIGADAIFRKADGREFVSFRIQIDTGIRPRIQEEEDFETEHGGGGDGDVPDAAAV